MQIVSIAMFLNFLLALMLLMLPREVNMITLTFDRQQAVQLLMVLLKIFPGISPRVNLGNHWKLRANHDF